MNKSTLDKDLLVMQITKKKEKKQHYLVVIPLYYRLINRTSTVRLHKKLTIFRTPDVIYK